MSIALGNQKPQQLLDVEKIIWRTIFTLSEGTKPPEIVMNDLLNEIPWHKLQAPLGPESEWFWMQGTPVSAAPPQNFLSPPPSTSPTTSLSDNNAMDQSLDSQPQFLNPTERTSGNADSSESGLGFKDTHSDGLAASTESDLAPGPTGSRASIEQSPEDTHSNSRAASTESDLTSTSSQDPIQHHDSPELTYRRSTRLILEKNKEDSLCSTSLIDPKRKTTPLKKRKAAFTGEAYSDVEMTSAGGSRARPIDVDALHAVLERFPVKRETEV